MFILHVWSFLNNYLKNITKSTPYCSAISPALDISETLICLFKPCLVTYFLRQEGHFRLSGVHRGPGGYELPFFLEPGFPYATLAGGGGVLWGVVGLLKCVSSKSKERPKPSCELNVAPHNQRSHTF